MNTKKIILILCDHFEEDFISSVSNSIEKTYHYPIETHYCDIDISEFYSPGRRQYNANSLLKVIAELDFNGYKKIALFKVDLFIPILTYIFGQAILSGNAGVVSQYRLRNELYGIKGNGAILNERFKKVILHEIGHMLGLIHCQNPICLMRSSTYVEDLDQKDNEVCSKCKSLLVINKSANRKIL